MSFGQVRAATSRTCLFFSKNVRGPKGNFCKYIYSEGGGQSKTLGDARQPEVSNGTPVRQQLS